MPSEPWFRQVFDYPDYFREVVRERRREGGRSQSRRQPNIRGSNLHGETRDERDLDGHALGLPLRYTRTSHHSEYNFLQ